MIVQTLRVGPYQTNCYLLHDSRHAWIIDPGFDGKHIVRHVRQLGLVVEAVVLTHAHWDHVMGLPELVDTWPGLPVLVHESESCMLGPEGSSRLLKLASSLDPIHAGAFSTTIRRLPESTGFLCDNDILDGCGLKVLHTPGHTVGSVSLVRSEDNIVFSGDTLFRGAVGRTDLPGGSTRQLENSIKNQLFTLPDTTTVYPGHGMSTTIGAEKKHPWVFPRDV